MSFCIVAMRVAVHIPYTKIMFIPEQGADLSLKDDDGNSVLHAIVQQTKTEPESVDALLQVFICDPVILYRHPDKSLFILEWTTRLDTSSRTLFVRDSLTHSLTHLGRRMSTSRRTSSYVITSDCH